MSPALVFCSPGRWFTRSLELVLEHRRECLVLREGGARAEADRRRAAAEREQAIARYVAAAADEREAQAIASRAALEGGSSAS